MKKKPKVLIVEDDINNHDLYRRAFEAYGFDAAFVTEADEFFPETVATINPDIISMDLMIERGDTDEVRDGFWAIEILKKDFRTHAIPIIVISNFFEETKVARAKKLGAVDFLSPTGQSISRIPEHFVRYLKSPKRYQPSHPQFH